MNTFLKSTMAAAGIAALLGPIGAFAASASEIHLTPDGMFSAKRILVIQKAGTNLFTRATWGQAFVRLTVLVNKSTSITKSHGEQMTVADINEGDILDVDGALTSGAETLMINPASIRDTSLQQESQTLSGVIKSIDQNALSFTLANKTFGSTKVVVSASVPIEKGVRSIEFSDLAPGDKILSVPGTYDYTTNTLAASDVKVYQDTTIFKPRNLEGTLKAMVGTALPAMLTVTVGSTDYNVYLTPQSTVLKKNKAATTLSRFVVGDTVRFYGAVRQTDLSAVDATTVRDLEF